MRNSVANFVRSLRTYARIRSLTTGTFNQVVKDRIAGPPERRRIQSRRNLPNAGEAPAPQKHSDCPRNLSNIPRRETFVNACIPQNFHSISTSGNSFQDGGRSPQGLKPRACEGFYRCGQTRILSKPAPTQSLHLPIARGSLVFRFASASSTRLFRPREVGRQKIEKRTYFWRSLP